VSDIQGFEYSAVAESEYHGPVQVYVSVSRAGGGEVGRRYSGTWRFAIYQGETRLAHGTVSAGQGLLTHKSVVPRAMRKAGFAD
jgi:hypothetical protein